jgi:MoaA/NifB/PqqE/SkfB family radical SAM enzyme
MTKFVCTNPWVHFEVNNPNGEVTMCCDNNTVLGNVNENSIQEIWNGEGYMKIRQLMRDKGAHSMCPHNCPVLQGGKQYQNLDWHADLEPGNPARENAEKNDKEYNSGELKLESLPRWMRFAYSYACNLDCYHCYQRDDALTRLKLSGAFMEEMAELSKYYQVILPFGGEPFLYRPVLDFMDRDGLSDGCKYFFITNATLLTERVRNSLNHKELLGIAVSLDAATEKSFDILRLRGRNASWDTVLDNLDWLNDLNQRKPFKFSISMTLNSVNFDEIERFVDLGIKYGAEPDILLVANPDQTTSFQKEFLKFSEEQFVKMFEQIDRSVAKVKEANFADADTSLNILKSTLQNHRQSDNNLTVYKAKNYARSTLRRLPESLQDPIRGTVNYLRARSAQNNGTTK